MMNTSYKNDKKGGVMQAAIVACIIVAVVPIIAMTANAFDEDVQRSLQVGMNAHLSKPVEPERLYQSLEELIWEAQAQ